MEFVIFIMAVVVVLFIILFGLYQYTFGRSKKRESTDFDIPPGSYYKKHSASIIENVRKALSYESRFVKTLSRDGIKLSGRLYEFGASDKLVIFFHGYRSSAIRDGNGIINICAENGYNILVVDQRAHGKSGGRTITFGIKERYDCVDWVNFAIETFGSDVKIVLGGLSMGAATVMMAAGSELPRNVRAIVEDCGYSSPRDILCSVIKRKRLPVRFIYFLIRVSAIVFGGFDPDSYSSAKGLSSCNLPVLFVHGQDDRLVPCEMSEVCRSSGQGQTILLLVPDAGHGMSFYHNKEGYISAVTDILTKGFEDMT